MKTIEERANLLAYKLRDEAGLGNPVALPMRSFHEIHAAMTELAADNNAIVDGLSQVIESQKQTNDAILKKLAEKEKEVAELKEKLATLAKDYSEVVAGESEMEELTRLRALLEEVKRVLGAVDEAMGTAKDHRYSDGMLHHQTHDSDKFGAAHLAVRQLLTRLGSHE